jgi:hypothetical protein
MGYLQCCAYRDCETMLELPSGFSGLVYCKKHARDPKMERKPVEVGLCCLCKQWKHEVDAWQHLCNDCVDKMVMEG